MISEELQDKAWKSLPEEYKKEVKKVYYNIKCLGRTAVTTLDNLYWLFGVQNLSEDELKEEEKKERKLYEELKKKYK